MSIYFVEAGHLGELFFPLMPSGIGGNFSSSIFHCKWEEATHQRPELMSISMTFDHSLRVEENENIYSINIIFHLFS